MQLEILEVVQAQHRTLLLLELHDRFAKHRHFLPSAELLVDRVVRIGVQEVEWRRVHLATIIRWPVNRYANGTFDVRFPSPERGRVDAEGVGDLGILRRSAQSRGQRGARGLNVARLAANRPWYMILSAELVQDGATNARYRESAERQTAIGVECAHGRHQSEGARAD